MVRCLLRFSKGLQQNINQIDLDLLFEQIHKFFEVALTVCGLIVSIQVCSCVPGVNADAVCVLDALVSEC